ncbi:uncharacterized protein Z519_02587 [Cladophialophora bantiana CBS 173.52]|uniref:Uncharacterized protein n=1 Tax=Cladophialophora bantiana (strain ATCC 10958 / CBS 173.52 / CDC B-1940 / NIH 8579) TaxID=1442370 RepID=A0A0D2I1Z3_CLAB1|nr:uncharacterized protein Z519_02587 [Cladophialophora bantiana CBS 173.52]KIW97195.1 hypothetical protein Z519_02587 [Cladophialophora bantiana CBS 173.52]
MDADDADTVKILPLSQTKHAAKVARNTSSGTHDNNSSSSMNSSKVSRSTVPAKPKVTASSREKRRLTRTERYESSRPPGYLGEQKSSAAPWYSDDVNEGRLAVDDCHRPSSPRRRDGLYGDLGSKSPPRGDRYDRYKGPARSKHEFISKSSDTETMDAVDEAQIPDNPQKVQNLLSLDARQRPSQVSILHEPRPPKYLERRKVREVYKSHTPVQPESRDERDNARTKIPQDGVTPMVVNGSNGLPEEVGKRGSADTQGDQDASLSVTLPQVPPVSQDCGPEHEEENSMEPVEEESPIEPSLRLSFPKADHEMNNERASRFSTEESASNSSTCGSRNKNLCRACRKPGSSVTPLIQCKASHRGYHNCGEKPEPRQSENLDGFSGGRCLKERESTTSKDELFGSSMDHSSPVDHSVIDPGPLSNSDQDMHQVDITSTTSRMISPVALDPAHFPDVQLDAPIQPAINGSASNQGVYEQMQITSVDSPRTTANQAARVSDGNNQTAPSPCSPKHGSPSSSWTASVRENLVSIAERPNSLVSRGSALDKISSQPRQRPNRPSTTDELPLSNCDTDRKSTSRAVRLPSRPSIGQMTADPTIEQMALHPTAVQPAPVRRVARRSRVLHSYRRDEHKLKPAAKFPTDPRKETEVNGAKKCEDCGRSIIGSIVRCARCSIRPVNRPSDGKTSNMPIGNDNITPSPITITISSDIDTTDEDIDGARQQPVTITISDDEDASNLLEIEIERQINPVQSHSLASALQQHLTNSTVKRCIREDSMFVPRKKNEPRKMSTYDAVRSLAQGGRATDVQVNLDADSPESLVEGSSSGEDPETIDKQASEEKSADDARPRSSARQSDSDSGSRSSMDSLATTQSLQSLNQHPELSARILEKRGRCSTSIDKPRDSNIETVMPSILSLTAIEALPSDEEDSDSLSEQLASALAVNNGFTQDEGGLFINAYFKNPESIRNMAEPQVEGVAKESAAPADALSLRPRMPDIPETPINVTGQVTTQSPFLHPRHSSTHSEEQAAVEVCHKTSEEEGDDKHKVAPRQSRYLSREVLSSSSAPSWHATEADEDVTFAQPIGLPRALSTPRISSFASASEHQSTELPRPSKTVTSVVEIREPISQLSTKNARASWTEEDEARAIEKLRARGVMFESEAEADDDEIGDQDTYVPPPRRIDPLWQPQKSRNLFDMDPSLLMPNEEENFASGKTPHKRPSKKQLIGNLLSYQCRQHRKEFSDPHQEVCRYPEDVQVTAILHCGIRFDRRVPQADIETTTMSFREFLGAPKEPVVDARGGQVVFLEGRQDNQYPGRSTRGKRVPEGDTFPFVYDTYK